MEESYEWNGGVVVASGVIEQAERVGSAEQAVRSGYESLKPSVLGALERRFRRMGLWVERGDLEDLYNLAWHVLYERLNAGVQIASQAGFIVEVAYRRGLDDRRRSEVLVAQEQEWPLVHAVEPDLAARMDDSARLRSLFEGLRGRLDQRECAAVTLCYLRGYSRREAAQALGVSDRRIEKIMDSATRKVALVVQEISGGKWCEGHASLIRAFALGLLEVGGERHRQALAHLRGCSPCRHLVLVLRHACALERADPADPESADPGLGGLRPRGQALAA
jgi:DNA-directed RNA polymerase specialized sigma24 family protein